ncbi:MULTISPECIES: DUF167 domain-containing protein [Cyanophyceae]|uniref:DUF167 domain-containing protein n=1 Tax=Cyanophyceae TaxID=3028117 RepID=UPI001683E7FD|nr:MULTISPECIES: DUF167 domain-containing protein [Cyanophyceae]MBD1917245.1 DUF167 domain-containing protein [Phormidium sp. FACHB-77]MBD2030776.1 DUF167 domain-containing protein [Phormidium sp. FACHB-322]MBD2050116.1 DUF167 domain-containing protein [Leptolyngbya sp. FACHB-60]
MTVLTVRVKPNAKQQKAICLDDGSWLLHLKAPPQDGKASLELIVLLAQALGIPKTQVHIKSGHTARIKRVEIDA